MNDKTAESPTALASHAGERTALSIAATLVLVGASFLNNVDRTVMSGLLQPLKLAFNLSDAAVGALSGVAFAIAYATLGLPFARVADVANRKWLLIGAVGIWSASTVTCGLAVGFATFFAARLGVAICEAAGTPAMHALFADSYKSAHRGRAASLIVIGGLFGSIVGVTSGGVIAEHFGWRMAFWMVGAPGIALAVVAMFVLKETRPPARLSFESVFGGGMRGACMQLLGKPSFRNVVLGTVMFGFWMWGTATWFPTFLVRSHGMSLSGAALSYGLLSGGSTVLGAALSAWLSDRIARLDQRWLCWMPALSALACAAFAVPVYLVSSATLALGLYIAANVFTGIVGSLQFAATYAITGSHNRALGVAALNFFNYLVGLGIAPMTVGAISDYLMPSRGDGSLQASLLVATVALPLSAVFFFRGARLFRRDVEQD